MAMRAVVTIPVYRAEPSRAERLSLAQCCHVLSAHEIVLVAPVGLDLAAYRMAAGRILREERFSPEFFHGIAGYNRLMTDASFYRRFADFDYLLVYQLDAWVFADELIAWCERDYDYVGAPWFKGFRSHEEGDVLWLCGNGGFSLRRVAKFLSANEDGTARRILVESNLWEDAVYAYGLADTPYAMRLPSLEDGLGFSFETSPAHLYERNGRRLPFGCHDWEHFQFLSFWSAFIPYAPERPRGGKLSIVTKVVDDQAGLMQTADSVLMQSFRDFEWIIVEANATREVRACIETKLKPYVAYFGPDCQEGLQHAQGEYVLSLNAGDALAAKNVLARIFQDAPDADVLHGDWIEFPHQGCTYDRLIPVRKQAVLFRRQRLDARFLRSCGRYAYWANWRALKKCGARFVRVSVCIASIGGECPPSAKEFAERRRLAWKADGKSWLWRVFARGMLAVGQVSRLLRKGSAR